MKVDAKDQTAYQPDQDQGESGTKPAVPRPQPRIYPSADSSTQSGAKQGRAEGGADQTPPTKATQDTQKKPEGKDKGTGDAPPVQDPGQPASPAPALPSPSSPPPSGNSIQVKVANVIIAAPSPRPGEGAAAPGHVPKHVVIHRSNRLGHIGGSVIGNFKKIVNDVGTLLQGGSKEEKNKAALQLGKDMANGAAASIDLIRVVDKKDMKTYYLSRPGKQGSYELNQQSGGAGAREQVELTIIRPAPKDSETQTPTRQHQTHDAGTQSAPIGKSDAGEQAQPHQSVKQTQAQTPTRSQAAQITPGAKSTSVQTFPLTHASTQTSGPLAQNDGRSHSTPEHSDDAAPNDAHGPESSPNSDKGTQTVKRGQVAQGTTMEVPARTDAGVQSKPATREGSSQQAPTRQSAQTQTSDQTSPTGAASDEAARAKTDVSDQPHDSATPGGAKTTTATQAGTSQVAQGTQTDVGRDKATQFGPTAQPAGTQTSSPSVDSSATQHTPAQASAQSQTRIESMSTETQTGKDTSKNLQTHPDVRDAATQSQRSTSDSATQAKPDTSDQSLQTQPATQSVRTQPPQVSDDGAPKTHAEGGQSAHGADGPSTHAEDDHSTHGEEVAGTQALSDHVGGAKSETLKVPNSVKGSGHWVVADIASLASDMNNVKNKADLGTISGAASSSALATADTLSIINTGERRALTLASKSLSLLGTAIGLAPSVGQLASDVKQLIANPKDEQSKWNVANSAFELGGGLAAAAASLVFPPAALLPIVFPNLAEIGHAELLRGKKNELYAQGLTTEGKAVEDRYKIAALDATPIVNWFSSTYTPELRPVIEKFEAAQGNKPGGQPAGELPVSTLHDQRVYDYYGQAMTERAQQLAHAARSYLKGVADDSDLTSVTMVSRSPQVFGWPTNGQAMRVFDRAVAISYDRVHDTVRAEFFGPDKDGTYRLATRDPSLPSGKDSRNLLFSTDMLNPGAKHVDFDMPQYFADSGTVALDLRKQPDKT